MTSRNFEVEVLDDADDEKELLHGLKNSCKVQQIYM